MNNIIFRRWFSRPPGQKISKTDHNVTATPTRLDCTCENQPTYWRQPNSSRRIIYTVWDEITVWRPDERRTPLHVRSARGSSAIIRPSSSTSDADGPAGARARHGTCIYGRPRPHSSPLTHLLMYNSWRGLELIIRCLSLASDARSDVELILSCMHSARQSNIQRIQSIGVDLAGILGDAWRAPKVGRCQVGWGMGRGVPSPAD